MKIHVYESADTETPPADRFMARIRCMMVGQGGKARLEWGPVYASAPTADAARQKMQTWWDGERERWGKLQPKGQARAVNEAAAGEAHLPAFAAEEFEEEAV